MPRSLRSSAISAKRPGRALRSWLHVFGKHLFGRFVEGFPHFLRGPGRCLRLPGQGEDYIHVEVKKLYPDAELPSVLASSDASDRMTIVLTFGQGHGRSRPWPDRRVHRAFRRGRRDRHSRICPAKRAVTSDSSWRAPPSRDRWPRRRTAMAAAAGTGAAGTKAGEALLERKSLELYRANQELKGAVEALEASSSRLGRHSRSHLRRHSRGR